MPVMQVELREAILIRANSLPSRLYVLREIAGVQDAGRSCGIM